MLEITVCVISAHIAEWVRGGEEERRRGGEMQ
jgi:hypothetical protein